MAPFVTTFADLATQILDINGDQQISADELALIGALFVDTGYYIDFAPVWSYSSTVATNRDVISSMLTEAFTTYASSGMIDESTTTDTNTPQAALFNGVYSGLSTLVPSKIIGSKRCGPDLMNKKEPLLTAFLPSLFLLLLLP